MGSCGLAFVSYGARIAIDSDDDALLAAVAARLPPRARATSAVPDLRYHIDVQTESGVQQYSVTRDRTPFLVTEDREHAVSSLASDAEFHVAVHARRKLFVHAGAVGWRGNAIIIPGRTFSGKSSLVAALIRAGAMYYSDEFAVLDRAGRVHPFPRPLALRDARGQPAGRHPAPTLGAAVGTTPLEVGLVLLTRFEPNGTWAPEERTPAEAMLALFANTVVAQRRPRMALATLRSAVANVRTLESVRGEADAIAHAILNASERASS